MYYLKIETIRKQVYLQNNFFYYKFQACDITGIEFMY